MPRRRERSTLISVLQTGHFSCRKPLAEPSLNASIFLVTSACEGFCLTILESQQCGCVPIVYDSFSAASELVIDGKNGILVDNNNRDMFVEKLQYLMLHENIRKDMSIQCVELSNRFSVENVAKLWNRLLCSL